MQNDRAIDIILRKQSVEAGGELLPMGQLDAGAVDGERLFGDDLGQRVQTRYRRQYRMNVDCARAIAELLG